MRRVRQYDWTNNFDSLFSEPSNRSTSKSLSSNWKRFVKDFHRLREDADLNTSVQLDWNRGNSRDRSYSSEILVRNRFQPRPDHSPSFTIFSRSKRPRIGIFPECFADNGRSSLLVRNALSPLRKSIFCRCSEIDTRTVAYMTIDINRRLLIWYGFINILNTITQLNEQLPVCVLTEVGGKVLHRSMDVSRFGLAYVNGDLYGDFAFVCLDLLTRQDDNRAFCASNKKSSAESLCSLLLQSYLRTISSKTCSRIILIRKWKDRSLVSTAVKRISEEYEER